MTWPEKTYVCLIPRLGMYIASLGRNIARLGMIIASFGMRISDIFSAVVKHLKMPRRLY